MKVSELEKLLIKTLTEAYINEYRQIRIIANEIITIKKLKMLGLYPLKTLEIAFCSCKNLYCVSAIPHESKKYAMLFTRINGVGRYAYKSHL